MKTEQSLIDRAHFLAHEIEWIHAKEIERITKGRIGRNAAFDAHAATELGNLIFNRMCSPNKPEGGMK